MPLRQCRQYLPAIICANLLAGAALANDPGAIASGDATLGEEVYYECAGCHQIGAGAEIGVGPPLTLLFGRRAGAVDGFAYSKSMQRAARDGLIWDYRTLDAYIENPKNLISGTRMNYDGLPDPAERAHLLAYLRLFSDDPSNIPEAAPTTSDAGHNLDPEILALQGDPDYGEYLSSECVTCHQTSGNDQGVPSIVAWPEKDFVLAMHAYRREIRPHPVMQMVAGRLSDEEIAALAAYFATLDIK